MASPKNRRRGERRSLNRERVLRTAIDMVDANGIEALSMRKLGQAVGVEAMSLYNHVGGKDDLLDGIVDLVAGQFELPREELGWKAAIRGCAVAAHEVLLRHPWSAALAESRMQSGPRRMVYLEAVVGTFRRGGFSVRAAYHANLTLDSYVYGFTLQEVSWPVASEAVPTSAADFVARTDVDAFPHLVEIAALVAETGFDRRGEFELGLDLILDGLERLRDEAGG
jgi:AcrR family transcriptional regulator